MESRRDITIDYLKFVGLIGLLIAHTSSNTVLLFIREFDVNLLIILSAMLANRTASKLSCESDVGDYWKKRFYRLALPTWIFITVYIIINYFFGFVDLKPINMIRAYLLQDNSIGYVWIIYVYLIVALEMPFLVRLDIRKPTSRYIYLCIVALYFVLYHLSSNYYYRVIVLYPIIYGLISILAINWDTLFLKKKRFFIFGNVLACVLYAIVKTQVKKEGVPLVGEYKYPPKLYYLTYTLAVAFLLIELFRRINFAKMPKLISNYIIFISKSSLWFYLWHIFTLQLAARFSESEVIRFLFVLIITSFIISVQNYIVMALEKKTNINKSFLKIFKG